MSGEFGQYAQGYFHTQMEYAAEDLEDARSEIAKKWGVFFREFVPVAKAISWNEACDSGEDAPIFETLERMDRLQEALNDIKQTLQPYRDCMRRAVREECEKRGKE